MENDISKSYLWPAQVVTMELLEIFTEICERNNLKYVVGEQTALGMLKKNGFMPWSSNATVILLYEEFLKFIKIVENELSDTPYYLVMHDNAEQFDEFYIMLAKRSKVKLGNEREQDEKYYDFYILIKPAFYAGNTIPELKKMERSYLKYYDILNSRCLVPGMWKAGAVNLRKLKSAFYYKKKSFVNFDAMEATLKTYSYPTKYIYIPNNFHRKTNVVELEQVLKRNKCCFESKKYFAPNGLKNYVENFYGPNYKKLIENIKINKAALQGPEILRRVQLVELELLLEFDRICRKHEIQYILGAGTFLGAVRHKGFIPWDDDVDVFMLYSEYKKFIAVAKNELNSDKYFLKTQETDRDCNLTYIQLKRNGTKFSKGGRENFDTHPGILLDILPLFAAPNTRIENWIQDRICKFYKTMTWAHIGTESEPNIIKRYYYRLISKHSNKESYRKFMKCATKFEGKTNKLAFFYVIRNFPENAANNRKIYEETEEIEFEGHSFIATKLQKYYLEYSYSKDYMCYPVMKNRTQKHMPAEVEVSNLYEGCNWEESEI